ncbi:MAG: tRNA (adenosine(37)-N6)-dimethylallyltransferase MiaA [Acidobacteriota bacterium]
MHSETSGTKLAASITRPLVVVAGPTGSGKSALGLKIASTYGGEIVNCDSLQLYRGFDVGTAKTRLSDRQGIRHHLLDVLEPDSVYSAGDYGRDAREIVSEISDKGRLPVVVGGTGFYVRALLDGLPELPGRDENLRTKLMLREERRPGTLHRLLTRLEPSTGGRVAGADLQKTLRALEIRLLTHLSLPPRSDAKPLSGYRVLQIGLSPDRGRLAEMIHQRTVEMFEPSDGSPGLVAEVKGLLDRGATGKEKPFEAIGYKQVLKHLLDGWGLREAMESTEIETRQYAKRQWTWFRRDGRVQWLEGFGADAEVERVALEWVRELLQAAPGESERSL